MGRVRFRLCPEYFSGQRFVVVIFRIKTVHVSSVVNSHRRKNVFVQDIIRKKYHILISEKFHKSLIRGDRRIRCHETATTSCGDDIRIRTHHSHFRTGCQRKIPVPVFQQHDSLTGKFEGRSLAFIVVQWNGLVFRKFLKEAESTVCLKDMFDFLVNILFGYDSCFQKRLDLLGCEIHSFRTFKIQSPKHCPRCGIHRCPVRYHYSLEAPLLPQNFIVQPRVFRRVYAPYQIVAVHHKCHPCLLDGFPECREIYLVQCPFINVGTCAVPDILQLVVGRKMLDRGHDPLILHPENILLGRFGSQVRVLSHIFIVPAAHRGPVDIHSRSQHDAYSTGLGIGAESFPHIVGKIPVPGGGRQYAARIKCAFGIVPDTLRAVCNPYGWYAQPFHSTQIE